MCVWLSYLILLYAWNTIQCVGWNFQEDPWSCAHIISTLTRDYCDLQKSFHINFLPTLIGLFGLLENTITNHNLRYYTCKIGMSTLWRVEMGHVYLQIVLFGTMISTRDTQISYRWHHKKLVLDCNVWETLGILLSLIGCTNNFK